MADCEQCDNAIVRGVRRRLPDLDLLRVQDAGLRTASDPRILEYAASKNRILLTHDARTMESHARRRLDSGEYMPGIFIIRQQVSIARAIEEIVTVSECSRLEEWNGLILYLPL